MKRAAARFGWAALFVAWAVDQLFWKQAPGGLSFPLWVGIALIVGLLLARSQKIRLNPWGWGLVAAALIFAGMTAVRRESFTLFISTLLSLFALGTLVATFQTGNWIYYRILDHLKAWLQLSVALIIRPTDLFTRKPAPAQPPADNVPPAVAPVPPPPPSTWTTARHQALPVARGLLLALPIVLILGGLLAAADPVFNDWMHNLLKIFDLDRIPEYIFRLTYILILTYILAGIYLHAIQPQTIEPRPQPGALWFKPFLGWTEAVVVLGAVNLLFLVFVGIQFWYLFGGQANISTTGFTYSEYARRGFNELVMVAILSLLLYLGMGAISRQESTRQQQTLMGLNILLVAQVLVILVSSFNRLLMYESAYGFTRLRTYTHILIVWLGVLLVAVIGLELTRRRGRFALAGVLVLFGFGLTFGLLNVDGFIAAQNIQRAQKDGNLTVQNTPQDTPRGRTGQLDSQYLSELSDDAVPTLFAEFQRPNQQPAVREVLGAELACRYELMKQRKPLPSWLSYNLSQGSAEQILSSNQELWKDYPIQGTGRSMTAKLSTGTHACQGSQWID